MSLRLNIGSGQRPFGEGWKNIDKQSKWNPDVLADGSSMPMFEDNAADFIVLHHVLEHFGCGEGLGMLKECYRILQPGGSLIITVPSLYALVKGWVSNRIDTQIFLTNLYGAYNGDEADRHKWGFTQNTLHNLLTHVGAWHHVEPFNFRPIEGADISKDWWILGFEAVK